MWGRFVADSMLGIVVHPSLAWLSWGKVDPLRSWINPIRGWLDQLSGQFRPMWGWLGIIRGKERMVGEAQQLASRSYTTLGAPARHVASLKSETEVVLTSARQSPSRIQFGRRS